MICEACTKPAKALTKAVIKFDDRMVVGSVGNCCAKLGMLFVIVDGDAPAAPKRGRAVPARPQKPTGLPKLEKAGFGIRAVEGDPLQASSTDGLTGAEAKVLAVVLHLRGATRQQISTLAQVKRANRDNLLSSLRQKGLIESDAVGVVATPKSESLALTLPPVLVGAAFLASLEHRMPPAEYRMLMAVAGHGVRTVTTRDELSRVTGAKRANRDNLLSALRRRSLIESDRTGVWGVPELFDGGGQ